MSIYIHIPFCTNICSYCDFAKVFYNEKIVDQYLVSLEQEINNNYKGEIIKTIYIGGGTPSSLNINQLNKLFSVIKIFNINDDIEFTFECNIEDTSFEKLELLYKNGVNRLSVGVQSFNDDNLKFLNRKHNKEMVINLIKKAKDIGFNNISCDLIYGMPNQSIKSLEEDLNEFLKLDINHISCYSLIIEEHTRLYNDNIENISEDLDYEMYNLICNKLKDNGFIHYEISNFSKESYQSKHNLVYWNNECYYGFGIGASGYLDNIRYDNTKSFVNYNKGNYRLNEDVLSKKELIENEFILGLRKIEGIDINLFNKKYDMDILSLEIINILIKDGKLINKGGKIYIDEKYLYISNCILEDFID